MIVKIVQTESNIKQRFYIDSNDFYLEGECGNISRLQSITLSNQNVTIQGVYRISKWVHYIPLRYLFGKANITGTFSLSRNGRPYGTIVFSKHGFLKSFYMITLEAQTVLHCYTCVKGSFHYVSVYNGTVQIALIETYLNTTDFKYTHKLYVLEEYKRYADTLSFFVVYYASFRLIRRFHMSSGSFYVKSWSFSKYNDKYDPTWRQKNFPDENFFGKMHLFQ